jgi:hypothetical protein
LQKYQIDPPQLANGAIADNDSQARQLKLYTNCFSTLQDAAYDAFPNLSAPDCYRAMEAVARLLHEYGGPLDSESFERWGKRKAIDESSRYVFLHLALGEYKRMILATIAKEMWTSAQDRSIEPEDLFSDVLLLIFEKAPQFLKNKRAKLSTRFCALAKRHVYFYYNSKFTKRLKAVNRRLERGQTLDVETLSEIEIASMKNDRLVSDLGYSEAGLSLV